MLVEHRKTVLLTKTQFIIIICFLPAKRERYSLASCKDRSQLSFRLWNRVFDTGSKIWQVSINHYVAFFPTKSGGFCQHCKTVGSIIFTYSCFLLIKISLYRLFLSCVSTCLFIWKSKKTACGSFHGFRKKSKTAFVKCARKKNIKRRSINREDSIATQCTAFIISAGKKTPLNKETIRFVW